jgi:hypothetical protein
MMFAHLLAHGILGLLWLAILGIAVWGAMRLLTSWQPTSAPLLPPPPEPSALEMLRRRYVAGEIDVATFEEMLEYLFATETPERARHLLRSARQMAGVEPSPTRRHTEDAPWTAQVREITEDVEHVTDEGS